LATRNVGSRNSWNYGMSSPKHQNIEIARKFKNLPLLLLSFAYYTFSGMTVPGHCDQNHRR
jgi:hypothetical protein